jgi:hypothetical protein
MLTVRILSLFLAIEKRKAERRVAQAQGVITCKVVECYSLPFLLRERASWRSPGYSNCRAAASATLSASIDSG